jgi:uroporphyrinogen decarboxylase
MEQVMTSREIIKAIFAHEETPRPGMTFDRGRINDTVGSGPGSPVGYTPKRRVEGEEEFYDDMWGNLWVRMTEGCKAGEVCKPVLEDWSQLDDLKLPEFDYDTAVASYKKGFAEYPDRFRIASMTGWVFNSSRYLRKLEVYLMDMCLYPEELKILHAEVAKVFENLIRAAGEAGADAIMFCEDMGTQNSLLFSPEMWNDYFSAMYAELFGLAHDFGMKVMMHSCGQNTEIIESLLKAGVDCFQFDQPTIYEMSWLAAKLREYNAILWSPIDIQKIMPTGDRELIEAGVDEMFEHFKGMVIYKNYGDLPGIGVEKEWDDWAYNCILEHD